MTPQESPLLKLNQREKVCWQCGRTFHTEAELCPHDGARLVDAVVDHREDPLIGNILDERYVIIDRIGEGGMGTIYRGHDLQGLGDVALKMLKADFLRDEDIRRRFLHEARIIANITHPNAVRVLDLGQMPAGGVYMVMELLHGESLAERLAYTFITYEEVFDIVAPICEVLDEAHAQGIVHRDLKPENIYLARDEQGNMIPKLLDFGVAKQLQATTMTRTGTLWGTPAYMSPEQARGDSIGPGADLYAIGIILYELICGNLPFHATTHMGYAMRHMHELPRSLHTVPGLTSPPKQLDELILAALAKQPDQRPESALFIANQLREIRETCFDQRLLRSTPAEEVDPVRLKIWMQEATAVSESREVDLRDILWEDSEAEEHSVLAPTQPRVIQPRTPDGTARSAFEQPMSVLPSALITLEVEPDADRRLPPRLPSGIPATPPPLPLSGLQPPRLDRAGTTGEIARINRLDEPDEETTDEYPDRPVRRQTRRLEMTARVVDPIPNQRPHRTQVSNTASMLIQAPELPKEESKGPLVIAIASALVVMSTLIVLQQRQERDPPAHTNAALAPLYPAASDMAVRVVVPPGARPIIAPTILTHHREGDMALLAGDPHALGEDHEPLPDPRTVSKAASSAVGVVFHARELAGKLGAPAPTPKRKSTARRRKRRSKNTPATSAPRRTTPAKKTKAAPRDVESAVKGTF